MGDDSRRAGNRVEYLVMPEGKKVRTHTQAHTSTHKSSRCPKLKQLERQNEVALDYKLRYKINIHEATLT